MEVSELLEALILLHCRRDGVIAPFLVLRRGLDALQHMATLLYNIEQNKLSQIGGFIP
jgi:hypothetical protein